MPHFVLKVDFEFFKATKGTYRYAESTGPDGYPVVGTLYVRKSSLGPTPPPKLTVTIEGDE